MSEELDEGLDAILAKDDTAIMLDALREMFGADLDVDSRFTVAQVMTAMEHSFEQGKAHIEMVESAKAASRTPTEAEPGEAEVERPWQPWERNFSGGRIGVQEQQGEDENWMILHVESGVGKTTTSLRLNEAWDLALMISPQVKARLEELFAGRRKAESALHQFKWADTLAPTLRKVADDWDCDSSQCEFASSDMGGLSCPHIEAEGCKAVEANEMREFADALELAAALRSTTPVSEPHEFQAGLRASYPPVSVAVDDDARELRLTAQWLRKHSRSAMAEQIEEAAARLQSLQASVREARRCCGFFASVIKSGEPWTSTCEQEYRKALSDQQGGV